MVEEVRDRVSMAFAEVFGLYFIEREL